ncbi:tripartite tricarboxylate transporter substrate binding protein [bacterium LRH843]|nr:tripartite tricarboxylate transporter substrate binding protein [bacterium LRH843]
MKRFWLVSVLIFTLILITACGSSDKGNEGAKTPEEPAAETSAEAKTEEKAIDFPKKPVTLIVPYSAGGGTDAVARSLASSVEAHLGQSVGVVNKTGGGGAVGMGEGANSKADGYTLTMVTVELTMLPHLGLSPTTYEDFKPVAQFNFDPSSIAVAADAPYDTLEEFVAYAKEHPGKIRIGNGGTGANGHLAASAFEKSADVEFNHVPFDGSSPALTALLGGHVEAVSVQPPEALPYVQSGDMKILGIMTAERLDVLPDTPTFAEAGFDMGEVGVWRGVAVPKDTPDDVVAVLSEAFSKAAEEPAFIEFMENNGLGLKIQDANGFLKLMEDSNKLYSELIPSLDLQ